MMALTPTIQPFFRRHRTAFGLPVARAASDDASGLNRHSALLPNQPIAIINDNTNTTVPMRAQPTCQPSSVNAADQSQPSQRRSYSLNQQLDSLPAGARNDLTAPSANMTMNSDLEVDMPMDLSRARSSRTNLVSNNNNGQRIGFRYHSHAGNQGVREAESLRIGFRTTSCTPLPIACRTPPSHLNFNQNSNTHSHGENIRTYVSTHCNGHCSLHPIQTQTNGAANNSTPFVLPPPSSSVTLPASPASPALSPAAEDYSTQVKRCGWCHTKKTRQWRKGTTHSSAGMTVLCNSCGINYRRALKKVNRNGETINLDQLTHFKGLPEHISITKTIRKQRETLELLSMPTGRRSAYRLKQISTGPNASSSTTATAIPRTTSKLSDKRGNVGGGGNETACVNRMSLTYILSDR